MTLTLTRDQEARLERSVQRGFYASQEEAVDAALNAIDPDNPRSEAIRMRLAAVRKVNFVDLFRDSPFAGLDIEFPRDPSTLREVDFD
jgi:Arc/MetJ-type ribon-helix-helix transcriptional regulator